MKNALVNGQKTEPQPKLQGICANCQNETISKCGNVKVWHWAHKSKITCDPWWENETEWHRAWKNRFPTEWQENIHVDSTTGEKHIADIKTSSGLVIEFQYSAIKPSEMQSREAFYQDMIWVVDGTRLKRDYPRFCEGFKDFRTTIQKGVFLSLFPEECLPKSWLTNTKPVYFDFQGINPVDNQDKLRPVLWCLFPNRVDRYAVIAGVSREHLIELASSKPHLLFAHEIINNISEYIKLQRELSAAQARNAYRNAYKPYARRKRSWRL